MSEWKNGKHAGKDKTKKAKIDEGFTWKKIVFAKLPKWNHDIPRDLQIMQMISFMIITFKAQCSDDENLYFLRNKTPPKLKAMYAFQQNS